MIFALGLDVGCEVDLNEASVFCNSPMSRAYLDKWCFITFCIHLASKFFLQLSSSQAIAPRFLEVCSCYAHVCPGKIIT